MGAAPSALIFLMAPDPGLTTGPSHWRPFGPLASWNNSVRTPAGLSRSLDAGLSKTSPHNFGIEDKSCIIWLSTSFTLFSERSGKVLMQALPNLPARVFSASSPADECGARQSRRFPLPLYCSVPSFPPLLPHVACKAESVFSCLLTPNSSFHSGSGKGF
jgi:hypothetical protein